MYEYTIKSNGKTQLHTSTMTLQRDVLQHAIDELHRLRDGGTFPDVVTLTITTRTPPVDENDDLIEYCDICDAPATEICDTCGASICNDHVVTTGHCAVIDGVNIPYTYCRNAFCVHGIRRNARGAIVTNGKSNNV